MNNSILGAVIIFLLDFFASPVPILLLVIAKVFFNKKFNNKVFWITFAILLVTMGILAITSAIFVSKTVTKILPLTLYEKFNLCSYPFVINFCGFFVQTFMYVLPVILVSSLIYFIKSKDKNVLKKILVTLLILSPFALLSYPFFVMNIKNVASFSDTEAKYMAECAIPPVKAFYSQIISDSLEMEYYSRYFNQGKNPDISSDDAKSLIDEYINYKSAECNLTGYDWNYLRFLLITEKFDELQKVIEDIENRAGKKISFELSLYVAQKDYNKALENIENINFDFENEKNRYYIKIYAGLQQYDKAYEYLEKYKDGMTDSSSMISYIVPKLYLDYKSGKIKLAEEDFEKVQPFVRENFTLDEYVKSLERVDF